MFYGKMQEATSNKVTLHDIKSATLHVVLQFIHTEDIDSATMSLAIDVYRAANFLLLPNLVKLVLERAHDIDEFEVTASFLNEVVISLPWNENTKDLYKVLLKPFYTHSLAVGDLNSLSENALELLLMKYRFNTTEYDLLLCVVEWAWKHDATAPSAHERRTTFDAINLMPAKPSARIMLRNNPSHTLLLKMMQYIDLSLLCPHRLRSLTEAVDVLTEPSLQHLNYACKKIQCSAGHLSELRGTTRFKWDQSKLASILVPLKEDSVVEFPRELENKIRIARTSTPCVAGPDGLCEWDIVVESIGIYDTSKFVDIGWVSESYNIFDKHLEWGFRYFYNDSSVMIKEKYGRTFGRKIQQGDVITFHLELKNGTCAMSINGHNYGVGWTDLPCDVNLYPAVALAQKAKYRINPHIRVDSPYF